MQGMQDLLTDIGSVGYAGGPYGDPTRLWAHDFAPKNLKQLFRWTEYLYYNSAQIFAGVRKYAEYPITEISYSTDSDQLRSQYKQALEESVGIRNVLIQSSIDLHVYGNSFCSVHLPFKRYLVCNHCSSSYAIDHAKYKFDVAKTSFNMECDNCGTKGAATVKDKLIVDPRKVHIIRWDPKAISISHNELTNESEYYLKIPHNIKSKIQSGNKHVIETTPISILEACKSGGQDLYKFGPNKIFHMRADAPAGVKSGWGYPLLTAAIPLFHHTMVLRKANEAIALERIVPMRVMSPAATSGAADPITTISISSFMDDLENNLEEWRKDPNHIMMSPIAVSVQQVGGEGRALMVDSEIQRAEDNIIASMGFPKEFVYGGLSFTGSSVTLRMLENQLESSVFQINRLLKWVADSLGLYMGWPELEVKLGDFKMVDDIQQKQLIMQLFGQQVVSKTTVAETHSIDLPEEQERVKNEMITDARMQQEIQFEMEKLQQDLAQQAKSMAQQGQPPGLNYDQQAVIAQAEGLATEFLNMDDGTRRSQLSALQAEDYVMYSVVIQRMEQLRLDQSRQQGGPQ